MFIENCHVCLKEDFLDLVVKIGLIVIFLLIKFENICQRLDIKANTVYSLYAEKNIFLCSSALPMETKIKSLFHWSFSKLPLIWY